MAATRILKTAAVWVSTREPRARNPHEPMLATVDRKDKMVHFSRFLVVEVLVVSWRTYTEMADNEAAMALCPDNKAGEVMYRNIFPVAMRSEMSSEFSADGIMI
jgi:trimethylamine:corrinoid methyltransferase-like protein